MLNYFLIYKTLTLSSVMQNIHLKNMCWDNYIINTATSGKHSWQRQANIIDYITNELIYCK